MSANRVGRPAAAQQQQTEPDADETIKRNRLICLMVSSGVIVVIGFCMIWSQRFSAIASVPFLFQHAVNMPFDNETIQELMYLDRDWYRVGFLDVITTGTFMFLILHLVASAEELLLLARPVNNLGKPQEAARHLAVLVFHAVTCVHAVVTIARGHFGMWSIWNGYPGTVMPFISKSFFLSQFAFWCQCVLYDSTFKAPNTPSIPKASEVYFHLVVLILSLFASNSIVPLIVCVLLPHSVLCFIETLAQLCELARADDVLIISLKAVYKYVSVFEHLWIMAASCIMCCYGEDLPIFLRLFATILSLCHGGYGLLKFYYEHFEQPNQQHGQQQAPRPGVTTRARSRTRSPSASRSRSRSR